MKKLGESGFNVVVVLLAILIISVLGFAGYYVYNEQQKKSDENSTKSTSQSPQAEISSTQDKSEETKKLPEGWAEYKEPTTGFILPYPVIWGEPKITNSNNPHVGKSYDISFEKVKVYGMLNSSDYKYTGEGRGAPAWYLSDGDYDKKKLEILDAASNFASGNKSYSLEIMSQGSNYIVGASFNCVDGGVPTIIYVDVDQKDFTLMSLSKSNDELTITGCDTGDKKPSSYTDKDVIAIFSKMAELLKL